MCKIIMMLLIPLLISSKCSRVDVKLTCAQIRSAKIDSLPICDLSFEKNRCRCRCFNLTDYKTVKNSACNRKFKNEDYIPDYFEYDPDKKLYKFISGDYDVYSCEGISGFQITDWPTEVRPKVRKLKNLYGNLCGR